ncbi:hypothetical protein JZ751_005941 [Albula glossodonta]|uniref:Major facilitator superfamily (MFS) profile domain-containing protein n=1 Tax=Albula glossodonta TaxID=121402 RepID=A0A8T2P3F5_9TELE|nr:hypothetical protein JZ751_005941 [Albula glossodonta]
MRDYGDTIAFLGEWGPFQKSIFFLLSVSTTPNGFVLMIMVFVAGVPIHHCRLPQLNNSSTFLEINQSIPIEETEGKSVLSSCTRYRMIEENTLEFYNDTEGCLDGWEFSTETYTSTIVSEDPFYLVNFRTGSELLSKSIRIPFGSLGIPMSYAVGYIPESPRWLLSQGRVEEAEAIIRAAAKKNGVNAPDVIFRAEVHGADATEFVSYGLSWLFLHYASRRFSLTFMLTVSGVTLLLIKFVPAELNGLAVFLVMVGKTAITAAFGFIYVYSTELFPTVVRSMGLGATSMASRIGSTISPYIIHIGQSITMIRRDASTDGSLAPKFTRLLLYQRFGRKLIFFATMAVQTVFGLCQAASNSWELFCVFYFFVGMGQIANYCAAFVLGSELLSKSIRISFATMGMCMFYAIGYICLLLVAYFIRGWRMLLVATALPGFLYIPLWWYIPESPRWLLSQGRVEEAEAIIRAAAKKNGVNAPDVIFRAEDYMELMQSEDKKKNMHSYTWLDLVKTTNMRNITILQMIIWLITTLTYYGISLNTPNLGGDPYLNCFFSAATEFVSYGLSWLFLHYASRRFSQTFILTVCGVTLLLIKFVPDELNALAVFLVMVGKTAITAAFGFIYVYSTELFPTVVRSMGLGATSMASRIGSIISPYIIHIGKYNKELPYVIMGGLSVGTAILSLLLPETKGEELPKDITQVKPLRRTVPNGYSGMSMVFLSDTPRHYCRPHYLNGTRANQSHAAPVENAGEPLNVTTCTRHKSHSGTEGRFSNETENCEDGWEYSTEQYISTIVTEWNLVCEDAWKVPFGRKVVLFITMAVQTIFSLLQVVSVSWEMFCLIFFIVGIGQISNYVAAFVLGTELLGKSFRVAFSTLGVCVFYALGYAILPLCAYFIRSWRMLLFVLTLPGFLYVPLWWLIPESPRWLLAQGRIKEADAIVRAAAKKNGVSPPEIIFWEEDSAKLVQKGTDPINASYTYLDLVRTSKMRKITILNVTIW